MPISSSNQLAHIFTKALPPIKIKPLLSKMNLVNFYGSAYGGVSKDSSKQHQLKIWFSSVSNPLSFDFLLACFSYASG